jgi:S1-C subfamily serine protease
MRFGSKKSFTVKLTEAPSEQQIAQRDVERENETEATPTSMSVDKLGISVKPLTTDQAQQLNIPDEDRGLLVQDVVAAGPSHGKLGPRDIIVAVLYPEPRKDVHTLSDLQTALSRTHSGDYVSLLVYRFGSLRGQGVGATTVESIQIP